MNIEGGGPKIQRRGESHATEVSEGHGRSGQGGFRRSCDLVGGLNHNGQEAHPHPKLHRLCRARV